MHIKPYNKEDAEAIIKKFQNAIATKDPIKIAEALKVNNIDWHIPPYPTSNDYIMQLTQYQALMYQINDILFSKPKV